MNSAELNQILTKVITHHQQGKHAQARLWADELVSRLNEGLKA